MDNSQIKAGSSTSNDGSPGVLESWPLYILGRNPYLIWGWLDNALGCGSNPTLRWERDFPRDFFGADSREPPTSLFFELREAIRELAIHGEPHASTHIELHRAIDSLDRGCDAVADFAKLNLREQVCDAVWDALGDCFQAIDLSSQLHKDDRGFRSLGHLVGKQIFYSITETELASRFSEVQVVNNALNKYAMFADATSKLGKWICDCKKIREKEINISEEARINNDLVERLLAVDQEIADILEKKRNDASEPTVIIDEVAEALTFFGVFIPFSKFQGKANAATGLAFFRVLAETPGEFVGLTELQIAANSGCNAESLPGCISRFRRVVREMAAKSDARLAHEITRNSRMFVVSKKTPRQTVCEPEYMLNLSRRFVNIISAPSD